MTVEEESTHKTGSWDQFEGNAHLINQPSTYNELLIHHSHSYKYP